MKYYTVQKRLVGCIFHYIQNKGNFRDALFAPYWYGVDGPGAVLWCPHCLPEVKCPLYVHIYGIIVF